MANLQIIYTDSENGVYELSDGTYYLSDNTPIKDYDPNTGAYQEADGTWYTFDGFPLLSYDKNTGNYTETSGISYDKNGNPINNNHGQGLLPAKPSVHTKVTVTPKKTNTTTYIIVGVGALLVLGISAYLFFKTTKK